MGKNTFKLEVMGQTKTLDVTVTDIKFIATVERPTDYAGEFGFDWMRWSYQNSCEDYDKLKKEYTPTEIEGEEYFVPWLSMFPDQKGVKLRLFLMEPENHTNLGEPTDEDIIKLPAKDGIRFEPEQMTLSEANDNDIVTVFCDKPLTNDITIDFLNRDDEIVGKLNVFKNADHEQLHFNITPVRILRRGIEQTDKNAIDERIDLDVTVNKGTPKEKRYKGFGEKNTDLVGDLQNLQTYLNTQSLNQALLQCTIGKIHDIVIDEDKWIEDELIIDEGCVFKDNVVLDVFYKEYEKQHPEAAKTKNVVVFLSPIGQEKAGGEGDLYDIDAKQCVIYYNNLWKKESFAHEISHVLGLPHTFQDDSITEEKVIEANTYVKQVDDYMNYLLENNVPKNEIANKWKGYKESYASKRGLLQVYYKYLNKGLFFDKGATENMMDYSNSRKSYFYWQWKIMQYEIKNYY